MPFFDDKQTGEVMAILNNDATNLERFLDDALHDSARLLVMVGGIAALLVWMNPGLAAVTLVAVPLMWALTRWFMWVVEPRYAAQRESVGDLNTRLENSLWGIELVKTSGTEGYETERASAASYDYFRKTMAMLRLNYVYRPGMELLAGLSFAATFVVGGWWLATGEAPLLLTGNLTPGTFVAFLLLSQRFVTPLAEVSNIVDQYENAKASSERVSGLMSIPANITDSETARPLRDPEGRVEYDAVDFAYEDETEGEPVIDGVSLTVTPGETAALVGPTGAGKSTVCKLLLRLYDVDSGAIRIDGQDVRETTLDSLRKAVGYVSQDAYLFDGTVRENLAYGAFEATDEELVEAARAAEAHAFIERLPRDTIRGSASAVSTIRRLVPTARAHAGDARGLFDRRARRGDLRRRYRDRGGHPALARPPHRRPDDVRDRPPTLDGARGRPRVRDRERAGDRTRDPRGTVRGERAVREPLECTD
jgi:ATP-binding cassette subfamily B protein